LGNKTGGTSRERESGDRVKLVQTFRQKKGYFHLFKREGAPIAREKGRIGKRGGGESRLATNICGSLITKRTKKELVLSLQNRWFLQRERIDLYLEVKGAERRREKGI